MDISKFLINEIKSFLSVFTKAKVRYGHDDLARIHTLEVYPSSLFDSDRFQKWEGDLIESFIQKEPTENICICPKDDIIEIGDILYEGEGTGYNPISICNTFSAKANGIGVQYVQFSSFNSGSNLQGPKIFNRPSSFGAENNNYLLAA